MEYILTKFPGDNLMPGFWRGNSEYFEDLFPNVYFIQSTGKVRKGNERWRLLNVQTQERSLV